MSGLHLEITCATRLCLTWGRGWAACPLPSCAILVPGDCASTRWTTILTTAESHYCVHSGTVSGCRLLLPRANNYLMARVCSILSFAWTCWSTWHKRPLYCVRCIGC